MIVYFFGIPSISNIRHINFISSFDFESKVWSTSTVFTFTRKFIASIYVTIMRYERTFCIIIFTLYPFEFESNVWCICNVSSYTNLNQMFGVLVVMGVSVHVPDRGIILTYRRWDGLFMKPNDPNTLTCQFIATNDSSSDPPASHPRYI